MSTNYDVELRGVTKRFAETLAVDDVSLNIERGKFLTLLGPSGCGKTTTLRMIGGFEYPTAGEIYISGEPMGNKPPYQRDSSMVFQSYALFPHMTVADNIGYGLRERKVPKADIEQRVNEMLSLVELEGYGNRKPGQLSGGQQQRVALARSLVIEPTVLLLDEPLGALDLKLRRQMQIELKRIQERVGITFVYVTHDQEEALTMSDHIAVMNHGKVEQFGSAEEIYDHPQTYFVADFMGAENILAGQVKAVEGSKVLVEVAGSMLGLPADGYQSGQQVSIMVRPQRVELAPASDLEDALWQATVKDRVYKGVFMHYQLVLPDGSPLVAEIMHDGSGQHFDEGEVVAVNVHLDDCALIPSDPQVNGERNGD